MMKRGFTIVELLMVIGIIGVLMGVVTSAASSSVRQARIRKADALCRLVQTGLATYHGQYGHWPVNGLETQSSDSDTITLSASQVRECVYKMVQEAKNGNPPMDISGLFVSRSSAEPVKSSCDCSASSGVHSKYSPAPGAYGLDFWDAVHGTVQSKKKMSSSDMSFGYPHPDNGRFMRFQMTYSLPGDSISVSQWHWPSN